MDLRARPGPQRGVGESQPRAPSHPGKAHQPLPHTNPSRQLLSLPAPWGPSPVPVLALQGCPAFAPLRKPARFPLGLLLLLESSDLGPAEGLPGAACGCRCGSCCFHLEAKVVRKVTQLTGRKRSEAQVGLPHGPHHRTSLACLIRAVLPDCQCPCGPSSQHWWWGVRLRPCAG